MIPVYIGYDPREHEAWRVCVASIARRSPETPIRTLRLSALRDAGLYTRETFLTETSRIDAIDRKPFSTEFSFSRFLVPALSLYEGWAIFCDCDFLFTAPLDALFELADDRYAAMCVKHQHDPIETVKMDGVAQTRYRRKNWSSLVLWNCEHPANRHLTVQCVNRMPGRWLHAFEWLSDDLSGELPLSWNWLSGVNEPLPNGEVPCGVHYTLGGPWFPNCQDVPLADLWRAERDSRRMPGYGALPSERERALNSSERCLA